MSGHPTVPVNGINTGTSTTSIPTGTTIIGGNLGGSGQHSILPTTAPLAEETEIISKKKLQDLVAQINPNARLDPDVEEIMLDITDDFIDTITAYACSIAKHRKSTTLEAKDLKLYLGFQ